MQWQPQFPPVLTNIITLWKFTFVIVYILGKHLQICGHSLAVFERRFREHRYELPVIALVKFIGPLRTYFTNGVMNSCFQTLQQKQKLLCAYSRRLDISGTFCPTFLRKPINWKKTCYTPIMRCQCKPQCYRCLINEIKAELYETIACHCQMYTFALVRNKERIWQLYNICALIELITCWQLCGISALIDRYMTSVHCLTDLWHQCIDWQIYDISALIDRSITSVHWLTDP